MLGKTALDSTTAIRYLNGDHAVVEKVLALPTVAFEPPNDRARFFDSDVDREGLRVGVL